jgi:hypothetical protein
MVGGTVFGQVPARFEGCVMELASRYAGLCGGARQINPADPEALRRQNLPVLRAGKKDAEAIYVSCLSF